MPKIGIWAAHAAFAIVLLTSMAIRLSTAETPNNGATALEQGARTVAQSHGLVLRESRRTPGAMSPAFVFDAPGCAAPMTVTPLMWTFEDAVLIDQAAGPDYARRYIYYDRSWDAPHRWMTFAQRMRIKALTMVGLTEYGLSPFLLVVEVPKACVAAQAIDWSPVWKRSNWERNISSGESVPRS